MADYIRPTPRNPILGLLADALTGGVDWMRDPRRAQQMQGLGGLLAETGIPGTMERLSYGEPLTKGKGMTTRLRPEAEAALMTLGPEAVPIGRGAAAAVRATKGLPVGMGIKNVGNETYLQSLRPVDVFGNGRRIDYYDDAKGIMYSATEYPKGTRWTAYDVLPKSEGGNQVIGEMDRFRSFADVVAGVRGARISEAAKARNAKYDAIPNTWSGEAKKIGKSLIDVGVEIDRVTSSTQSKSKYIYLENGKKIRISDHELPNAYDAPEFDFRYGGDIKSLVKQIKDDQVAQTFEYPQEEALRLAQQRAALPVSEGGLGLPPNNTPMDRARAMGFDTDVYHGRKGDFQNFDTSFAGMSTGTKGVARKAIDATNDPSVASDYALNSRPPEFFQISDLLRKLEKVKKKLNTDPAAGDEFMQLSKRIREIEEANPSARAPFSVLVERAKEQANVMPLLVRGKNLAVADSGKWNQSVRRDALTQAAQQGFDGVVFKSVPDVLTAFKDPATYTHDTYAILNPSVVRSRFAAFDPTRRNEPDLLAGALPFTALLDEENRTMLEERLGGLLGR